MEIIDISPVIHPGTAVFPGDTPYSRKVLLDFSQGHNLLLSSIETTVHIGAHADAPCHYHPQGQSMEQRDLSYYLGPCQVVQVQGRVAGDGVRIFPQDLAGIEIRAPRLLFATQSFPDPDSWKDDFTALSPELVHFLKEKGVVLVGIDTPSVDPSQSKSLETHQSIFQRDMAILEGLVLHHVTPGLYTLVALPLKIKGADASPVRAVLLRE